jgi:hypothetical protein
MRRLGEIGPDLSRHRRRRLALDPEQQPGLLRGFAHRGQRQGAGELRAWIGNALAQLRRHVGM